MKVAAFVLIVGGLSEWQGGSETERPRDGETESCGVKVLKMHNMHSPGDGENGASADPDCSCAPRLGGENLQRMHAWGRAKDTKVEG